MSVRIFFAGILPCICVGLLTACSPRLSSWDPADYTIKSGDTLFSIAWKYEIDPFELARWNNITTPYVIYPGQRLKMEPGTSSGSTSQHTAQAVSRKPATAAVTVKKGDTLYSIAKQHNISTYQLASINRLRSPYTLQPGQTLKLKAGNAAKSTRSSSRTSAASSVTNNKKISWRWPVEGKVISTFSYNKLDRKGIKIAGKEGKAVRAAAPGKVVYSGNGLISYGNLVIIKHNRTYLSAYAHNRKLLVKEGDVIKTGQVIAELGKTGADSPRLHFEIRKNGKPVNPLKYLPRS